MFRAIDDIEALTRNRSVAFGIADTTLGDKRLEELENSLFSSFEVSSEKRLEADGEAPGREILSRGPDTDLAPGPSTGQRNTGEVNPSPDVAPSATDAPADAPAPGGSRTRTGNPTQKPRKAWLPRNLKEDE